MPICNFYCGISVLVGLCSQDLVPDFRVARRKGIDSYWFIRRMTFVRQSGSGSEARLVWAIFSPVYQQTLFTHTLANMASCVAVGYQTIKERDYNGGRPLEEKGKKREWRRRRGDV